MGFLNLPPELRNMIYAIYFADKANFKRRSSTRSSAKPSSSAPSPNDNAGTQEDNPYLSRTAHIAYRSEHVCHVKHSAMVVRGGPILKEVIINQEGYLHANLPMLSLTCRQIFSETWKLNYGRDTKFVVHINHLDMCLFFDRSRVYGLLESVCSVKFSEQNTTVILHGIGFGAADCTEDGKDAQKDNLIFWLRKYWTDGYPLFDTSLKYVWQPPSRSVGMSRFSGGHTLYRPPVYRKNARYEQGCLRVIRYLRFLHSVDVERWRECTVESLLYWPFSDWGMDTPFSVKKASLRGGDTKLLQLSLDVVARMLLDAFSCDSEGICGTVRKEARDALRDDFDEWEEGDFERSLPPVS